MGKDAEEFTVGHPHGHVGKIVLWAIAGVLAVLLVASLFSVVLTSKNGGPPNVFGYSLFIVRSDSMQPTIPEGAAILVRACNTAELRENDVITFRDGYDSSDRMVVSTARILSVEEGDDGLAFHTQGDNRDQADKSPRKQSAVIGKALYAMVPVGKFLTFAQTPLGLVVCIAVPLVILLIIEIINLIRLSRKPDGDPFSEEEEVKTAKLERAAATASRNTAARRTKDPMLAMDAQQANPIRLDEAHTQIPLTDAAPYTPVYQAEPASVRTGPSVSVEKEQWPVRPPLQPQRADLQGIPVPQRPEASNAYFLSIPTEESDVPLEHAPGKAEEIGTLSYVKTAPAERSVPPVSVTQEFHFKAETLRSVAPNTNFVNTPVISEPVEERITVTKNADFAANMAAKGQNHFKIEGIDVKVKQDALDLALGDELQGRDISITVTNEYTNVTVGSAENEVNFALFHEESGDGQKVIIQRKNK